MTEKMPNPLDDFLKKGKEKTQQEIEKIKKQESAAPPGAEEPLPEELEFARHEAKKAAQENIKAENVNVKEETPFQDGKVYSAEDQEEIHRLLMEQQKTEVVPQTKEKTGIPEDYEKDLTSRVNGIKLSTAREACANALYLKEKAGSELDKEVGFFKRIFLKDLTRETLRGKNEDYKKLEDNYKKSQEEFKAALKEYRLFSIEEKRKQLEKNREEFLKILPNGEKIPEDVLKNVKLEDLPLINSYRETDKTQKKPKGYDEAKARKENFINYLKEQDVSEVDAEEIYTKMAFGELRFGKESIERQMEINAKQIAIETSAKEAVKLFDAKENLTIQEMGATRKWVNEKALWVTKWYRGLSPKTKIAVSIGLGIGGVVGGLAGGVPGTIILSSAFAGRTAMRILGGVATTAGVEQLSKQLQERSEEKKIEKGKDFAGKFLESLNNQNDKLDEKLFEALGRKESQKRNRYIIAGVAGGIVGSGALAYAFQEIIPDSFRQEISEKLSSVKDWIFGGGTKPSVDLAHKTPEMPGGQSSPSPLVGGSVIESGPHTAGALEEAMAKVPIGSHGPEGNIIDYLRDNHDIAKNWGWDESKMSLDKFAGTKAHEMWLKFADAEIAKPEVQAQLEDLGYSKDLDGYAQMMHRIGAGSIEIDSQGGGSMKLADTSFLKALPTEPKISEVISGNETGPTVPGPYEDIAGGGQVEPVAPGQVGPMSPGPFENQPGGGQVLSEQSLDEKLVQPENLPPQLAPGTHSSISFGELERLGYSDEQIKNLGDAATGAGRDVVTINELIGEPLKALDIKGIPVVEKINFVTEAIKKGTLSSEDFGKYYASKLGIPPLSPEIQTHLNTDFEVIKIGDDPRLPSAKRAIEAMVQRIEKTK